VDRDFQPPPSEQDKSVNAVKGDTVHLLTPLGEGFSDR
jgi:hypothetical protein